MPGLPESFNVAKRVGIFIYIAAKIGEADPIGQIFSKYKSDFGRLKSELEIYSETCLNRFARKKLNSGLISPGGATSFSKYVRMGHGLGFFDFNLKAGILSPNWVTSIVRILIERISREKLNEFKLPDTLKLLATYLLITKDRDLVVPLVNALKRIGPDCRTINTKSLQLEYARNLESRYLQALNETTSQFELGAYVKRLEFFRKNISLLEENQSATSGLKHMIESRVNWLFDLSLVDEELFCNSGLVKPLDIWECVDFASLGFMQNDRFFKRYVDYIKHRFPEGNELFFESSNMRETVHDSVMLLKREPKETLMLEPVLLLSWLAINTSKEIYVPFSDILQLIESNYVIYRRKMGGLGFIQI